MQRPTRSLMKPARQRHAKKKKERKKKHAGSVLQPRKEASSLLSAKVLPGGATGLSVVHQWPLMYWPLFFWRLQRIKSLERPRATIRPATHARSTELKLLAASVGVHYQVPAPVAFGFSANLVSHSNGARSGIRSLTFIFHNFILSFLAYSFCPLCTLLTPFHSDTDAASSAAQPTHNGLGNSCTVPRPERFRHHHRPHLVILRKLA